MRNVAIIGYWARGHRAPFPTVTICRDAFSALSQVFSSETEGCGDGRCGGRGSGWPPFVRARLPVTVLPANPIPEARVVHGKLWGDCTLGLDVGPTGSHDQGFKRKGAGVLMPWATARCLVAICHGFSVSTFRIQIGERGIPFDDARYFESTFYN